ncbi:MarR family transcriptional regulator [Clostridium botulinum]|uniref:MarR-family transcriptional regulator n=1 Tax=Clostridium botulinum (strain Hall / ATCC 3502 / NCTC 13319 / Type A) TaxID=441771 RepID=A5I204_CLOBH|nr:MarR family transcriptional regulator [Clostridium botulinum]ABS35104.1 transcriptional regulator, MarR family [Clostridium botulinum A str. ATCC 19397]ABS39157.1 transcriptional regulator, MarR family [Clostridium botulinum A str. Hall]AWB17486.1 MarR family transcriptional regulator [Clostridium botulinum]EGT5615802.1 MarR family transcriptional regulator [Clostridium botulinum]EGT5622684.1 MarR family transcriptional regulator [Clostridium botulinum]
MDNTKEIDNIDKRYHVFGMLFLLSNKLEALGNNFLGELTTKQWFFMLILMNFFKEPPTLSELALEIGTSHQNAKQIAIKLEEKGFLVVKKDTKDKRVLRLTPTNKIEKYVKLRKDKDHFFIEKFFNVLTKEEVKNIYESFTKLLDNIKVIENKFL